MEIVHLGHACFKLRSKNTTLVIDPFSEEIGLKMPKVLADAVLVTHHHSDHCDLSKIEGFRTLIEGPGEYEIGWAEILGVPAFHDKVKGAERGKITLYKIKIDGLTLVHLGDLGEKLSDKQVEDLSGADILMVPTGGTFSLDAAAAGQVVTQLEPKIVIPMHYLVPGLKFALSPVENFLKVMGKEEVKPQPKLVISKDKLPEELVVAVLE